MIVALGSMDKWFIYNNLIKSLLPWQWQNAFVSYPTFISVMSNKKHFNSVTPPLSIYFSSIIKVHTIQNFWIQY